MSAMSLAPIDRLWVVAEVPESTAARLKVGISATVSVAALPGERLAASVLEVLPLVNESTRTVQARLELANPGGRLAAGMLADVTLAEEGARSAVLIPVEALIRTGRSERVIVALGEGRFAPREVRAGGESGDEIEILHGLEAGEKVVVAPIDISALRAERERRIGHDMRAHFRSEIHEYSGQSYFPAGGVSSLTVEDLRKRIRRAKDSTKP